jgi:hypothetical protein
MRISEVAYVQSKLFEFFVVVTIFFLAFSVITQQDSVITQDEIMHHTFLTHSIANKRQLVVDGRLHRTRTQ